MNIEDFFRKMVEIEASDLYLTVAKPPMYRTEGKIEVGGDHSFTPEELARMAARHEALDRGFLVGEARVTEARDEPGEIRGGRGCRYDGGRVRRRRLLSADGGRGEEEKNGGEPQPAADSAIQRSLVVLSRALLGLGVVVAALQRHPVGLDVLAARQEVGPGVARHRARRSSRPRRTGRPPAPRRCRPAW